MWRRLWKALGLGYRAGLFARYVKYLGIVGAARAYRRLSRPGAEPVGIEVPGLQAPVFVRGGSADASTFEKVFLWREYDLHYPPDVKWVIDAGANIGLSAIVFAQRFPEATVIAVEPEGGNFHLLERNTACYRNVIPLRAAIWGVDTTVRVADQQARVDSYSFVPSDGPTAERAYSMSSLLSHFGIPQVDVLKMDIEGAETAVFSHEGSWIEKVGLFVVELHGAEARSAFEKSTRNLTGRRYFHGESDVLDRSSTEPANGDAGRSREDR